MGRFYPSSHPPPAELLDCYKADMCCAMSTGRSPSGNRITGQKPPSSNSRQQPIIPCNTHCSHECEHPGQNPLGTKAAMHVKALLPRLIAEPGTLLCTHPIKTPSDLLNSCLGQTTPTSVTYYVALMPRRLCHGMYQLACPCPCCLQRCPTMSVLPA